MVHSSAELTPASQGRNNANTSNDQQRGWLQSCVWGGDSISKAVCGALSGSTTPAMIIFGWGLMTEIQRVVDMELVYDELLCLAFDLALTIKVEFKRM
ncbi:hypothetical protein C8J55DRAFT_528573 [Lentinula edodes]|uniref:Uncharacterized protein n=1 Tax=Lentinula lateritia TaxID=40482 RepID=A0A9W8ZT06_9AGAR|nr:hypothetical protein C8J55DRAFT_528573 [Lentinula edodes]